MKRINGHYILTEIASVLNFQKGILYTIKELAIRPGQNIRSFISEDRNRLVKPIMFLLITSLIYSLCIEIFHFNDGYSNYNFDDLHDSSILIIYGWIYGHYGYANLIMAIFIAVWVKVLFKNYSYNFYEILILLFFIMGIGMLIISLFGVVESIIKGDLLKQAMCVSFLYCVWAIGQFFDKRKFVNYVKAVISYFAGIITFSVISIGVAILIDLLK